MTANLRAISGGRNVGRPGSDELYLLVIDPRSLTRDCLVAALEGVGDLGSVIAAGSAEEAAAILAGIDGRTAALLNLASDAFDHPTLSRMIEPLRQAAPGSILVLTTHVDAEHARAALSLGIAGFLSADMSFDLTVEAIRIVSRGWIAYPRSILEQPATQSIMLSPGARRSYDAMLTGRQRQVLEGLSRGLTNRQIATSLRVTERTVKAHVKELMRRLGASNRTQVVAITSAYP
ncbi:response regulator transcription factor [Sphingomonas sp. BT-65]|uniref:response regulator transcription factor n=1 Tax=Sphingomonas sp. BT-65 TaxID=2989821 RepID=UPI00223652A5|nr:response regulator transcription factor [Sphingomonas sp. BT-65]MCW4463454.1 response regulator transcription factor [Sphingomonas sp. BT-65]